jgi:hypothetical protein
MENAYTAFEGSQKIAQGSLSEVVLKVKKRIGRASAHDVLIFSDDTGKTMDISFEGGEKDLLRRLEVYTKAEAPREASGPGRPKLGVISREVSLLPRHWEWLATQSGGASATIRNLIEEARKKSAGAPTVKQVQERTYKFMYALAGDLPNYEEALRALYKRDKKSFVSLIAAWPKDVREHAALLSAAAFGG